MSFPLPLSPVNVGVMLATSILTNPEPPAFTPAAVPQLKVAFAGDYGVTGAGANVAGAYGTSRSLSVPGGGTAPTMDAYGLKGYAAFLHPGGAVKTHIMSSGITLPAACRILVGCRADHLASTKTAVGRDTNNQEAIRIPVTDGVTNATFSIRLCATAAYSLALGRPVLPGGHYYEASRDAAGLLTFYQDGESLGSQAGHVGDCILSSLGYNATGANTWEGLIGEVLILDESVTPVSAEHLAALRNWMETRWRSDFNMDGVSGNDANDASTPARARKTLSALNSLPFREGQRVSAVGTFAADAVYFDNNTASANSTSTRPWVIDGDDALIEQSTTVPGPWTSMGGGVYKTTIALVTESTDGEMVLAGTVESEGIQTRIWTGTSVTPSLNQQFYDGTDLYLNIGADPTGKTVKVSSRGTMATTYTNAALRAIRPHIVIQGFKVNRFPGNGFRGGHAAGLITVRGVKVSNVALDGFNIAAGSVLLEDCEADDVGRRPDGAGSAGDAFTPHGPTNMTLRRCIARGAGKGGIAAEQAATIVVEDCEFWDCFYPIILLAQGSAGTGSLTIRNSIIHRSATAGQDAAILAQVGLPAGYTINVIGCRFIGDGPTRGKCIDAPAQVIVNQSGNVIERGFLSLT